MKDECPLLAEIDYTLMQEAVLMMMSETPERNTELRRKRALIRRFTAALDAETRAALMDAE